jgi:glycosyltransferase involved in cell wall biosynthesis
MQITRDWTVQQIAEIAQPAQQTDPLEIERAIELSIVMPCLNEAETLGICIDKAQAALQKHDLRGEVIIADNGSTDGSIQIAESKGARVVHVPHKGYGAALTAGFKAAHGRYIIMGDSDDSYDFGEIMPFVERLRHGDAMVMGTRMRGKILSGAMPVLHRYFGNPVLTGLGNLFFHTRLSDYHCGMRGFDRQMILDLGLRTPGMEFATEMIAKAALHKSTISEVPITYHPDGRTRAPHLRTWRDGWRHLRFMLLLSPAWTFLYPGLLFVLLGIFGMVITLPGTFVIGEIGLDVHTLLVSGVAVIVGFQILTFWLAARLFAASIGLIPLPRAVFRFVKGAPLGTGLVVSVIAVGIGIIPLLLSIRDWQEVGFGALNYKVVLRQLIPGLVLIALGVQALVASFIVSLLNFAEKMVLES